MADSLEDVERKTVEAVAGKWSREVEAFRRALLARWSANGQSLTPAEVRALASKLDTSPAQVNAAKALLPAAALGDARVKAKTKVQLPSKAAVKALTGAQAKPRAAVAESLTRAAGLDLGTVAGVLGVLGPLGASVNAMKGAASYAVNAAANEALASAAEQADEKVVFIAERDACVDCITRGGDTGEAALTDPPPLHPWCRCELGTYDDPAVPLAMKRESVRSVLRGFSLPSESNAARLRAAQQMLRKGPVAPASVKRYAAAAIKSGKFGAGRSVPYSK